MNFKVCIYPFRAEDIALVCYLSFFRPNFEIKYICSDLGSGFIQEDIAFSDNRMPLGYTVNEYNLNVLKNIDVLIITSVNYSDKLYHVATEALIRKIDVINLSAMNPTQNSVLVNLSKANNVNYNPIKQIFDLRTYQKQFIRMFSPDCPVIFIGGICDEYDITGLSLQLAKTFYEKGIKANVIGESDLLQILGFSSYKYILESNISEDNKVKFLNFFIENIYNRNAPDILIITIPGHLARFNDIVTNDFGIYAYMLSQAIKADFMVFCSPMGLYDSLSFEKLSVDFAKRYDFNIDCVCLVNKIIDSYLSLEQKTLQYVKLPEEHIENFCEINSNIPILNMYNTEHINYLCNTISEKFI